MTETGRTPDLTRWAQGYGVIAHSDETRARIEYLAEELVRSGSAPSRAWVFEMLAAADRTFFWARAIARAMWNPALLAKARARMTIWKSCHSD